MLIGGSGGMFLSPIPEPPGDPAALDHAAAVYTAAHGEIQRTKATLTGVAGQAGGGDWTGIGATDFAGTTTTLADAYGLTAGALARGAVALKAFSHDLAAAKQTARQANAAVATANAAASALIGAQSAAELKQLAADDAAQTATTARAHAAANPHAPAAQTAADLAGAAANDAHSAATSAWNHVTTLTTQWQADHSRAVALIANAHTQATRASAKAATAFDAAATELAGGSPHGGRGAAHGVPGGGVWQTVIGKLATLNDHAGWGLNAWGSFGVVVLGRAGLNLAEKDAQYAEASEGYDAAISAVFDGNGGFFGPNGWYAWQAKFNEAQDAKIEAAADLDEAVAPTKGFVGGVLGRAGLGLGMASDLATELKPSASWGPDGMLGGNTDRVMAGLNFGASGLALGSSFGLDAAATVVAVIPGGQVVVGAVLLGTSAYFAGEFVYQHWSTIAHWGSDAWGALDSAGSWTGHTATSLGHDISKAWSWL